MQQRLILACLVFGVIALGRSSHGQAINLKICVDPGHGGFDPGAVGCDLEESMMALDAGLRLRDLLLDGGFEVIVTRDTDVYISLAGRTSYANANGADRFVSVHINSSSPVASGIETFCYTEGSSTSFDLRDRIQQQMVAAWPLNDRGGKTANFYVLENSDMAATLSELGFINNCSLDAQYIADPDQREMAAQAHLFAIQSHLGLPVTIPGGGTVQPPTKGTAEGVVFEDTGQGSDDVDIRLEGATVEILETGDSVIAEEDGYWSLKLEQGTYTLKATLDGYDDGQRTCEVPAGGSEWCSIGLVKQGNPLLNPSKNHDGGTAGGALDDDPSRTDTGCSCRIADASPVAGGLCFALGLVLLCWTRMRRLIALTLMGAGLALAFSALAQQDPAPGAPHRSSPQGQRPVARLTAIRQVASGQYQAPVLAPSGQRLVFAGPKLDGLYLVPATGGPVKQLSVQPRAGYLPIWRADSRAIGLRSKGREFSDEPLRAIDLAGQPAGSLSRASDAIPIQLRDCIYLRTRDAMRAVACGNDRYYAPQVAADGRHLVYSGLTTGLHLYRLSDGQRIALGPGHQPSFSADGRFMVFARIEDDGHRPTASDIWITDLRDSSHRTSALTRSPDRLEQFPSLSYDAKLLAFSAGGHIYLADVVY